MKLKVLGCSGNVTRHHRTTAYLVNDRVLFDAGTVTEVLAPARLERISHVFLSHVHLDHVKGLCSLAEELSMREEAPSLIVLADEHVIEAVSQHVFNNCLWPDFTVIPEESPVVSLRTLDPRECTIVHGLKVTAIPVHHKVYTTGFLVKEGEKTIMMTSDTGMTEQFWETAKRENSVEFIVAHVAFPNRLSNLAALTGHMTPSVLLDRIDTYHLQHVLFYIAHTKSMFEKEIREEIRNSMRPNLRLLTQDEVLLA
jgi:ribonuclease BN (tRNA processing enzyme)